LVLGDLMLDIYKHCTGARVAPESPSVVGRISHIETRPGGAANVANNLATLGADVVLVGVAQGAGIEELANCLSSNVLLTCLPGINYATTDIIRKTRYVIENKQVFRSDQEDTQPSHVFKTTMYFQVVAALLSHIATCFEFNCIVVSDYLKGTVLNEAIIPHLLTFNVPVFVDTKDPNWARFAGVDVMKVNASEYTAALTLAGNQPYRRLSTPEAQHKIKNVIVTDGVSGIRVHRASGTLDKDADTANCWLHFPALRPDQVVDVTGAGDTVLAAVVYKYMLQLQHMHGDFDAHAALASSVQFATHAAAIAVSHAGTTSVMGPEVEASYNGNAGKVFEVTDYQRLQELLTCWRERGYTIAMTNGCFDVLHPGHVYVIDKCATHAHKVVVAINSDAATTALKGANRPCINQRSRAFMLAALQNVDAVVVFDSTSPAEIIKLVNPNVLVKDASYQASEVIGAADVEANGGKLILIPRLEEHSTTHIISKFKENNKQE